MTLKHSVEPSTGNPRRGLLAASVITLAVVPILALSNLRPPPASTGVEARGDSNRIAAVGGPPSILAAYLGEKSRIAVHELERATLDAPFSAASPRLLPVDVVDPIPASDVTAAEQTTTAAPTTSAAPTTTRRHTTTVPTTTAAPLTTVAPTTVAPTTVAPTTVAPTTVAPTTIPVANGQTIYGQPYAPSWPSIDMWDRLSVCEAGGNWTINAGNGYYGGLQFGNATWESVGGSGHANQASREEQIYRGNLLWEKAGWDSWPGCKRKVGWSVWQTSP